MPKQQSFVLPSIAIALSGALWGLFWLPARHFNDLGINAAWTSTVFFGVTALVLMPIACLRLREIGQLKSGHLITGLLMGGAFTLYALALVLTTVVNALLLFYLTPIWSTLLGRLLLKEPIGWTRISALALGIAGLVTILDPAQGLPLPRNPGDWIAFLAGVIWAYGSLRSYSQRPPGMIGAALSFASGGLLVSCAVALLSPEAAIGPWPTPGAWRAGLSGLLALALVVFLPTNFLVVWGTERLNPARVGILLMTEIVAGTLSAALWSGEPFGARQVIGALLIMTAGVVEVLGRNTSPAAT